MSKRYGTPEDRFWRKVDKNGPTMPHMDTNCWIWTAFKCPGKFSYGKFQIVRGKGEQLSHRIGYIFAFGDIPHGLDVLHRCDRYDCVRPDHLYLGDDKQNMADKISRGRAYTGNHRGAKASGSHLTENDVIKIRALWTQGDKSQREIAQMFDTTQGNVSAIILRKSWSHI